MKEYSINIADYIIRFENRSSEIDLLPSEKLMSFQCNDTKADITIRVNSGCIELPENAVIVFDAPYVEEINGMHIRKSDDFWKIRKSDDDIYITCTYPLSPIQKRSVLKFSFRSSVWDLTISGIQGIVDPMEYPLDGLLLYYLTVMKGDIFIHASGADFNGKGILFSGISGKGKTTMARLCEDAGAKVIHDDRLILRKSEKGFFMYNTPVYRNEKPASVHIERIYLLEHSLHNEIISLPGASAISMMLANCIQHNWNRQIVENLLEAISYICSEVPVSLLRFLPDSSVIKEILEDER